MVVVPPVLAAVVGAALVVRLDVVGPARVTLMTGRVVGAVTRLGYAGATQGHDTGGCEGGELLSAGLHASS
jgi:hypothetical protein